ncbi:MAG: type IV toxin-antitoxin system AbiEi family antitoxin [Planctomycetota bacterium]|nr:type IV toxin-antitoxin system AbiEi family antitoxin [Planctomycetota bacterium]
MAETDKHLARFEELLRDIFAELGEFESIWEARDGDVRSDVMMVSKSSSQTYRFDVKVRERITPQIADDLFERLQQEPLPERVVRIVYAPVISARVAEIARQHGISFIDYAGNCHIVDRSEGLLISRTGIPNEASSRTQKTADPFSPKSSRIVRAMLHEPERGWQVSELASHPDVDVSVGLVSKVKRALVRESYAIVRDRLLYLKQPLDLLAAWTRDYPGPSSQRQFYMRGETEEIESKVAAWCEKSNIEYALARFSAAWRHAPEVRYSVASLYVGSEALSPRWLESLRVDCGAKEVESGANLVLLTAFDRSVFVRRLAAPEQTSSPLQTYLDLQSLAGRGSEAAEAVFEKHLRKALESTGAEKGVA